MKKKQNSKTVNIRKNIAQSIRNHLSTTGATASELAYDAGIHRVTMYQYTSGNRCPSLRALVGLSKVMNTSIDKMISGN